MARADFQDRIDVERPAVEGRLLQPSDHRTDGVVTAQIVVEPPGALASVPDALRSGAVGAGLVVFLLARRSIFAGASFGRRAPVGPVATH